MSTLVKFKLATDDSKLSSISTEDGSVIVAPTSGDLYLDYKSNRISLSGIVYLPTEFDRLVIEVPLSKLYYIKETNLFWYYSNGWIKLNQQVLVDLDHDPSFENVPSSQAVINYVNSCLGMNRIIDFPTLSLVGDKYVYELEGIHRIEILNDVGELVVPDSYIRDIKNNKTIIKFNSNFEINNTTDWKLYISSYN